MTSPRQTRERRLRRRHGLDNVRGNVLFSHECRILDVSDRGLAVRTTAALAPGRSYAVKIQHEGREIPIAGTVAWCRLRGTERTDAGESVPVYTAGLELDGPLSRYAGEILPLLEERGVARLERRIHGHLTPRSAGAAPGGHEPAAVVVREVSRTGMVVEVPLRPERGDLLDLSLEVDAEVLTVTLRTLQSRSLGERDGRGMAEVTVEYAEMAPADRARLDRLIRDELGLAESATP